MSKKIYLIGKICCINCKSEIRICNFEKHINGVSCSKGGTFLNLIRLKTSEIGNCCKFCGVKNTNKNSLVQHQLRCSSNPDKLKHTPSYGMLGKKGMNQYTKAQQLGLPKPEISIETRNKLKLANKNRVWSDEMKIKHSDRMKKAVIDYPESYSAGNQGRVKVYEVDGIKLKGTWEVKFYNWCKQHNIGVTRPNEGFEYEWNGLRTYFPDFYLPEHNVYIEIKGYETDRDQAKWGYFPHKLKVIRKTDIKLIENDNFNLD